LRPHFLRRGRRRRHHVVDVQIDDHKCLSEDGENVLLCYALEPKRHKGLNVRCSRSLVLEFPGPLFRERKISSPSATIDVKTWRDRLRRADSVKREALS